MQEELLYGITPKIFKKREDGMFMDIQFNQDISEIDKSDINDDASVLGDHKSWQGQKTTKSL